MPEAERRTCITMSPCDANCKIIDLHKLTSVFDIPVVQNMLHCGGGGGGGVFALLIVSNYHVRHVRHGTRVLVSNFFKCAVKMSCKSN